MAVFFLVSSL